ncbi:TetR/AcrR family transcriptional regulator [Chachezhania sediminis]|uniref:TetR/AcrR family transcriptional regulator n=1 Tax=Chachezhania sediminis TaxID=2599291 RepID=UPI00131E553E|nr:TetR/AcrR family transcriptional regulator [Chachezhania sediminis]
MSQDTEPKPRGRPPSKAARAKALAAAHAILMEDGFGRLTIEAVAARSGVSKPTIYRNWANAGELAMAALIVDQPDRKPALGAGLEDSLRRQMRSLVQAFATTRGRQIAMTLAAADPESEMTRAFRNRVILSSRAAGAAMIEAAVARGEIRAPADPDTLLDMLYAPVFYRLLVGHRPLGPDFAEALVTQAMVLLRDV